MSVCLQCGGIIVDVNISDHSTVISLSEYYEGAAPALLINHTPWVTISYRQRSEQHTHILSFLVNNMFYCRHLPAVSF